jgi:hypothetical protein
MLIPRNVLSALTVACNTDNTRYAMGGIRLERGADGRAVAVATDGRRLIAAEWDDAKLAADVPTVGTVATGPAPDSEFAADGAIIPVADCKAISRASKPTKRMSGTKPATNYVAMSEPDCNGTARMAATDGAAVSAVEVQTIEGRFPRWREAVPGKRCRVTHFTFQDSETNEAQTKNGPVESTMRQLMQETQTYDGRPADAVVRVTLDARFLAEIAKAFSDCACDDEHRSVELIVPLNPEAPVELQKTTPEGLTVRAVLMPLAPSS